MSQNDTSDDETDLQTPRMLLSAATSHSRNNLGIHNDNDSRICLYQP